MPITLLTITDFRNLASFELTPIPHGLNLICGKNGSGKTSILEAIHYLAYGKSFRTSTAGRLIKHETEKFSLFSHIARENESFLPVGAERAVTGSSRLRIAGADAANIAELASLLPIRVINSQSHQLLEAGPSFRRKFIDWGLFYQADTFLTVWRQFERVLKQRNTVLKNRLPKRELDVWTAELVSYGNQLDQLRRDYIGQWQPLLAAATAELLGITDLELIYHAGWDKSADYSDILAASYHDDMRYGSTQHGPHRADMDILIEGVSAKHFLSRGQQKLLICAMIVAQGMLLSDLINKAPIYLVDDLPSELDERSGSKLVSLLAQQQSQVFITAIDHAVMHGLLGNDIGSSVKVFHVEHGRVKEI